MKVNTLQTDFTAGMISPLLLGRTDTELFFKAAREITNAVVLPTGGITRRDPTEATPIQRLEFQTSDPNKDARLEAFPFSDDLTYTVEFSNHQIRVYTKEAVKATLTRIYGYDLAVPYGVTELSDICVHQSEDVLFITHPKYPPMWLGRYADTDWRLEYVEFMNGPYLPSLPDDNRTTLSVRNVNDRMTLKSDNAVEWSTVAVNDLVEYPMGPYRSIGKITSKISNSQIIVEPYDDLVVNLSKEVYSPGAYNGWDSTNSVPLYVAVTAGPNREIAFSATNVVTQESIGSWIRFVDNSGQWFWINVTGIKDILKMGAYGIIAVGTVVSVPAFQNGSAITRHDRMIKAQLVSSRDGFFVPGRDTGRWYRLGFDGKYIHAKTVAYSGSSTVLTGKTTIGATFVEAPIVGVSEGMSVSGTGIDSGTYVTGVSPYRPSEDIYGITGYDPILDEYTYGVVATIPARPSGFSMSKPATATNLAATLTVGATGDSTSLMNVLLSSRVPRTIQGMSVVDNGSTNDWRAGSFYAANYPRAVCTHQGRLVYAGSPQQPQSVWLSKTGDYYDFATTNYLGEVLDDSAIDVTVDADRRNEVKWMVSRDGLVIGASNSEWFISGGGNRSALTPRTVTARQQSGFGSASSQCIVLGKSMIYVQAGRRSLRRMMYNANSETFESADLMVRFPELYKLYGQIKHIAYVSQPVPMILAVTTTGKVLALTYEEDHEVTAWSVFFDSDRVASLMSVPAVTSDPSVFLLIERTANVNRTVIALYPERITLRPFLTWAADTSPRADGMRSAVADSYGVVDLGDYRYSGRTLLYTVNGQWFTKELAFNANYLDTGIANANATVRFGLPYATKLKSYPIDPQGNSGTSQGKVKRMDHASLRLLQSGGFQYRLLGAPVWRTFSTLTGTSPLSQIPGAFEGDLRVQIDNGHTVDTSLELQIDGPWPFTLLAIYPETKVFQ